MPDIIRSKSIGPLYSKKLPERARFVRSMPVVTEFEQALVSARSEIEQALRRFAKKVMQSEDAA